MRSFVALSFIGLAAAQKGRQTSEPVYSCPPPFELIGKQCTRQSSAPAQAFCTSGILQNGNCLTPAPRDSACPPGSTPANSGCAIIESIPAEKFCAPGTHDIGGECQTYSVTGIIEVCARGQLVGGQCELAEQVQAIATKTCPLGYSEQKGSCWKTEVMDCTNPNAGMGKRLLQAKGGAHGGMGGFGGLGGMGGFGAPAPIPAPKYAPAPAKLAVTQKQCEVKLEAPFTNTASCPQGMTQQGNNCVSKQYEPATVQCSLGAPHLCFPTQSSPANHRCPAGFTLAGELCEKKVAVPKNAYCGPGLVEHGAGCAAITAAPLRCGPGATLAGDMCIATETTAPIVSVNVQCRGKNCFH